MKYKALYKTTLDHWKGNNRKSINVEAESEQLAEFVALDALEEIGIGSRKERLSCQLFELEIQTLEN